MEIDFLFDLERHAPLAAGAHAAIAAAGPDPLPGLAEEPIAAGAARPARRFKVVLPRDRRRCRHAAAAPLPYKSALRTQQQRETQSLRMYAGKLRKILTRVCSSQAVAVAEYADAATRDGALGPRYRLVAVRDRRRRESTGLVALAKQKMNGRACRERLLSWPQIARLVYTKMAPLKSMARSYDLSVRTVRRQVVAACWAFLVMQDSVLNKVLEYLRSHPPTVTVCNQLWDETGERISLSLLPGASTASQVSAWQVLVCRKHFAWAWISDDGKEAASQSLDVVCPPLPLVATGAQHLWNALHFQGLMQTIQRFQAEIHKLSSVPLDLRECDGASGNDRYNAFVMQQTCGSNILSDMLLCGNHANQLGETHVMVASGFHADGRTAYVNDLYCMSLFLRMSGHFVRMMFAVKKAVDFELEVLAEAAPAGAHAYSSQMVDYLLSQYRRSHDASEKACARHKQDLDEFFTVFNGWPADGMKHFAGPGRPDRSAVVKRATTAILRVVLLGLPAVPAEGFFKCKMNRLLLV